MISVLSVAFLQCLKFIYRFLFLQDPKQIIPSPDPGKSSGSGYTLHNIDGTYFGATRTLDLRCLYSYWWATPCTLRQWLSREQRWVKDFSHRLHLYGRTPKQGSYSTRGENSIRYTEGRGSPGSRAAWKTSHTGCTCTVARLGSYSTRVRRGHIVHPLKIAYGILSTSVVDPDPHGSGTFDWIQIRNYCSGSGCSKILYKRADK